MQGLGRKVQGLGFKVQCSLLKGDLTYEGFIVEG